MSHDLSRRDFLQMMGAIALLPLEGAEPDSVLYNGNIHTTSPRLPEVEAVAISGGRFLQMGNNAEIRHLGPPTV